ncbi:hypothetical protein AMS68_001608 [Peltaster fructicola]|uniref:BTB domain-containing protein n=1 Tax=Peltaster fructicola TaxID=286661 RepID=A0A6H0XN65_9PEZI|nr:hypothetical protein AMS68_001608 [Peltaster fructicola]
MASFRGDFPSASNTFRTMSDQPQSELLGALRQLYRASEYSDLTIISKDGDKLPAHRAIVCPRSSFLAQAVRERRWHDNVEGQIALMVDEPDIIGLVFEYLYMLDYVPHPPSPSVTSSAGPDHDSDSLSVRTDPIHFGHVYGTSAVSAFGGPRDSLSAQSPFTVPFTHSRDRSESQLTVHALPGTADFSGLGRSDGHRRLSGRSNLSGAPDPSPLATREPNLVLHAKMYAAGERYGVKGLKSLAHDKFKIQLTKHWDSSEFSEAIHVVYNSTPSSDKDMRETVADTIGWHGRMLEKPEIEVAIMEINGLAYELLKRARRAEPEYS